MSTEEPSEPFPFHEGRLPMTDEELRIMERNRRLTRRIMVPMMTVLGICGVVGGIFAILTEKSVVGIGLTFSAITMLGFALFYFSDTRKPVELPEKFFVTGVITGKRKRGSAFTSVYYEINLNRGTYTCYVGEEDFKRLKAGDKVQCERLVENSVFADRVVVLSN